MKKLSGYSVLLSVIFLTGCLATVSPTIANKFNEITNTSTSNTAPSTAGATRQNTTTAIVENKSSSPAPQTQFVVGELGELLQNIGDYLSTANYRALSFAKFYKVRNSCKLRSMYGGVCNRDPDEFLQNKIETGFKNSIKVNDSPRTIPSKLVTKTKFQARKQDYSFKTKSLQVVPTYDNFAKAKLTLSSGFSSTVSCFTPPIPDTSILKIEGANLPPFLISINRVAAWGHNLISSFNIEPDEAEKLFDSRGIATFEGEVEFEVVEKPTMYASTECGTSDAMMMKIAVVKYTVIAGGKSYVMLGDRQSSKTEVKPVQTAKPLAPSNNSNNNQTSAKPRKGICALDLGAYQKQQCVVMTTDNFRCIIAAADRYKNQCP